MIIQTFGAFISTVAFSVVLRVPKKYMPYVGIGGALGWFVYLLLNKIGFVMVFSTFVAASVVALISHTFARIWKAPVTIFLISGILPLVPGLGMYRTVYQITKGNSVTANFYLTQTLQIAGVIAIAIFIMDSIFRVFQKK